MLVQCSATDVLEKNRNVNIFFEKKLCLLRVATKKLQKFNVISLHKAKTEKNRFFAPVQVRHKI